MHQKLDLLSEPSTSDFLFWKHYDKMYADKDYDKEARALLPWLGDPRIILDVGCGTGNHAAAFARQGRLVVGIDLDPNAIKIAREKKVPNVVFLHGDITELRSKGRFDAVVSLFNVVNYVMNKQDLVMLFKYVSMRLRPGGCFIFDCWNGEAALADPPKDKVTQFGVLSGELDRENASTLLTLTACIDGEEFTKQFWHKLWTIQELKDLLEGVGFVNVQCTPWMRPFREATIEDWKVMFIAENSGVIIHGEHKE